MCSFCEGITEDGWPFTEAACATEIAGTVTLDVPAEGVCDESVVADAVFDQHYQPLGLSLAKRKAQIDAGLLSTNSAWIKYTSAAGTFYVHLRKN